MNKKEASEIRRAIKKDDTIIHTIYSSYVDVEGNKQFFKEVPLYDLDDQSLNEYLKIFQKVLSNNIEKNLLNLAFEKEDQEEKIEYLYNVVKNENKSNTEGLIDEVIEALQGMKNYSILIGLGKYDIPVKDVNGEDQGYSDNVYNFIIIAICPVDLSKPSLQYLASQKELATTKPFPLVLMPDVGFVYPNYSHGGTNVNELAYYVKKPKEQYNELKEYLKLKSPLNADEQKERFISITEEAFNDNLSIDTITNVNETIKSFIEEKDQEEEPAKLSKLEINNLLEESGSDYQLDDDDIEIMAENIVDKDYTFKLDGIQIKVKDDMIDFIEQKDINGKKCLVIPVGPDSTLNGVKLK